MYYQRKDKKMNRLKAFSLIRFLFQLLGMLRHSYICLELIHLITAIKVKQEPLLWPRRDRVLVSLSVMFVARGVMMLIMSVMHPQDIATMVLSWWCGQVASYAYSWASPRSLTAPV